MGACGIGQSTDSGLNLSRTLRMEKSSSKLIQEIFRWQNRKNLVTDCVRGVRDKEEYRWPPRFWSRRWHIGVPLLRQGRQKMERLLNRRLTSSKQCLNKTVLLAGSRMAERETSRVRKMSGEGSAVV